MTCVTTQRGILLKVPLYPSDTVKNLHWVLQVHIYLVLSRLEMFSKIYLLGGHNESWV